MRSSLNSQIYVGSTRNLRERLSEHNRGKVYSTKRYTPWELMYYEAYKEEKLARMREKKIKHHGNAIRQLKARIGLSNQIDREKNSAGFTLIELLIVIAILGVLSVALLALINPLGQIQKSNDAKRKNDLSQLQRTLEAYYNDNGNYPFHGVAGSSGCPFGSHAYTIKTSTTGCIAWGDTWTTYNTKVPQDPTSTKRYVYFSSGQSYLLYAGLERASDPQKCSGTECSNILINGIPANSCGGPCNYGVSSPNTSP